MEAELDLIYKELDKLNISYKREELLKEHCTFKTGGSCLALLNIKSKDELKNIIKLLNKNNIEWMVIGKGSNILFSDEGYEGFILKIEEGLSDIIVDGGKIIASSGATMEHLSEIALENSLTGAEFICGIPGTIGGGCIMNAGAYGGQLDQIVSKVNLMDRNGDELVLDNSQMEFSYRTSFAKKNRYIVISVELNLKKGEKKEIKKVIDELTKKREDKQPLDMPSAGSTFKRPEGYYAGKLIEDAGLKGVRFGGAMVSSKHSGFIVNTGNATTKDIMTLIRIVQKRVKEEFGVDLETEVRLIGR